MIDLVDSSLGDGSQLNLLLLRDNGNQYCTAVNDWLDIFAKYHRDTHQLNFENIMRERGVHGLEQYVLNYIDEKKIDVVYINLTAVVAFRIPFLEELQKRTFTFCIEDDAAQYFSDRFRYVTQCCDGVLCHDYIEKYRFRLFGSGALFLPMVSNPVIYLNEETDIEKKDIGVSFVGRLDRVGRGEFLNFLQQKVPALELYGPGTKNGMISKEEKVDVFRRSKIGLNFCGSAIYFHNKSTPRIDKRIRQVKGRIWELALCKTLVFTEYGPELERSFEIDKEIVVFEGNQDLEEKLKYYLEHDDERREVALKGYERAKKDIVPEKITHTFLNWVADEIEKKKTREPLPVLVDEIYEVYVNNCRVEEIAHCLQNGQKKLAKELFGMIIKSRHLHVFSTLLLFIKFVIRPYVTNNNFLSKLHGVYTDFMNKRQIAKITK